MYEGGAATWECAGDIVKALLREETPVSIAGKRVLEVRHILTVLARVSMMALQVGCGSAVPSLWLLQTFFAAIKDDPAESDTAETVVVLQDYNDEGALTEGYLASYAKTGAQSFPISPFRTSFLLSPPLSANWIYYATARQPSLSSVTISSTSSAHT